MPELDKVVTYVSSYHPRCSYINVNHGIKRVLSAFQDILLSLGSRLNIRVATRNGGQPLALKLRREMQSLLGGRRGRGGVSFLL